MNKVIDYAGGIEAVGCWGFVVGAFILEVLFLVGGVK